MKLAPMMEKRIAKKKEEPEEEVEEEEVRLKDRNDV